jgi:N-acetylglucosaminyldiphosphoundecaprenol N-acetyl-beta-D-mannosaminyltransferase
MKNPATAIQPPPRIRLLGMPLSVVTEEQAVRYVIDSATAGQGGWVITPNLDQLRLYRKQPTLRPMYEEAALITADGMPLVWASRLQKTPLPQRVAGSSMIFSLSKAAAEANLSIFFLGGNPGAAEKAAEELTRKYPGLRIVGIHCPDVGFEKDPAQMKQMIDLLTAAQPSIVYVALGFPKQEKLIEKLRPALPNAWYLGIGISFSFVAGEIKRAPKWMQKTGMEWMHRMVQEPGRLLKRYLVHGIPFAATLLTRAFFARFSGKEN